MEGPQNSTGATAMTMTGLETHMVLPSIHCIANEETAEATHKQEEHLAGPAEARKPAEKAAEYGADKRRQPGQHVRRCVVSPVSISATGSDRRSGLRLRNRKFCGE